MSTDGFTSTAAGLGILFAIVASYVTKGKGQNIYLRVGKFVLRKIKKTAPSRQSPAQR